MTALSWWDHYGVAACIVAFGAGYLLAFVIGAISYVRLEKMLEAEREIHSWYRDRVYGRTA